MDSNFDTASHRKLWHMIATRETETQGGFVMCPIFGMYSIWSQSYLDSTNSVSSTDCIKNCASPIHSILTSIHSILSPLSILWSSQSSSPEGCWILQLRILLWLPSSLGWQAPLSIAGPYLLLCIPWYTLVTSASLLSLIRPSMLQLQGLCLVCPLCLESPSSNK